MEIVFAKEYGFCYGVKRAVEMAEGAGSLKGSTYTLGHLIHNPQVVAALQAKGIGNIDHVEEVPEHANLILRSHGVGPAIYDVAQEKKCHIVDATCPHVKKAQKVAADFYAAGKQVLIVGDAEHPEVKSIIAWGVSPIVIQGAEQVGELDKSLSYGVLCQTTLEQEKFVAVLDAMQQAGFDFKVQHTICPATRNRQNAAVELANTVDAMLVVGGFHSANTTHLYELVKDICPSWHIETSEHLRVEMFSNVNKLGITAGASTPEWLLQDIVKTIESLMKIGE